MNAARNIDCFRSDEFHARFSHRPPDEPARPNRVAAIECHLEVFRQVDRIRDLETRAFVGQIAHDTIDDRGATQNKFCALQHTRAPEFTAFSHSYVSSRSEEHTSEL